MHPRPLPLSAPFGCPNGGEGRERLKHLPSAAWGRASQVQTGDGSNGVSCPHLRLTCVGLASWVSCLGPCLAGLPSPRQQHLGETRCLFDPKRAMLGLCTPGSSGTRSPQSELTPHQVRTWLTHGCRSL